jgi:hypothetical protein
MQKTQAPAWVFSSTALHFSYLTDQLRVVGSCTSP